MWNPLNKLRKDRNPVDNEPTSSPLIGPRVETPLIGPRDDDDGRLDDVAGAGSAPIASISVGTTGLNRSMRYHKRMYVMKCDHRIQSMVAYDCNQVNINRLLEYADVSGVSDKIVVPEYLPFAEGFLRRVDQYERHYGAIERDMEGMVKSMKNLSLEAGTEPQIILEWIGFGGHAMLSDMLHQIVKQQFPESRILPIVCFPDDRSMHKNIRDHKIWDKTMEVYGRQSEEEFGSSMLLTDNRRSADFERLDEQLTTALASIEACWQYREASGSLAEVVSEFNLAMNRWIVVENTEIPLLRSEIPADNQQQNSQTVNRNEDSSVKKARGKVAQQIKDHIFKIAHPENCFQKSAFYQPGTIDAEQRIYVTIPVGKEDVDAIREDIEDQLVRERFTEAFPGTHIAYAFANPRSLDEKQWRWVHISKLVGLAEHPTPASITSIINNEPSPDDISRQRRGSVMTEGERIRKSYNAGNYNGSNCETGETVYGSTEQEDEAGSAPDNEPNEPEPMTGATTGRSETDS